ncbi:thiol reductant ABC exporter subunit CydC [Subtercola endophyticus]|uniref:thiol reductant ABC exporter subunit CydC n=1 Tax=Subtercola endophyticus TaxID=2895559 RepID=UPI001E5E5CDD|nr:thiol reductant ABC exporter subunit CydC [Subtercola endophyticus]UFS60762.1 thiol reductant ABC exporter subunit CydC [Subtercola endophyticus]
MLTSEVLRLAQPRWRIFAPGVLFGVFSAAAAVALLATSAWLITRAADEPPILFLSAAIVGVRAAALGRACFRYLERLSSHDAAFRGLTGLRVGIYERLVPLAPDGVRGTKRGDLLARLVGDVDELQNLPLRVVQPVLTSVIVAVAAVVGTFILLPAAGIALAVALIVAFVLGTVVNSRLAGRAERDLAPLRADFAERTLDVVSNLDVLVAFDAVDARLDSLRDTEARLTAAALGKASGSGAVAAVVSLLAGLATLAALLVGIPALGLATAGASGAAGAGAAASASAFGTIDGPVLAMLALVPIAVFEVFGMVPLAVGAWRQVRVSAARVADAVPAEVPLEIPVDGRVPVALPADRRAPFASALGAASLVPAAPPLPTGATVPSVSGDSTRHAPAIELRDLSARWPGAAGEAVERVSLSIRPGERVLVTGVSGAGKTTLAHALVRFLEYGGSYTVDGVEARSLPQAEVRRMIGLCEQQPYLFDANLRQNLLFARDTATDDELLAVLDRVGLLDWAEQRGGLGAALGEHGALVSGGQAQRIALARVLLTDFAVVVFDEPTANVDSDRADRLLVELLAAAGPERSVLLISHAEVPPGLVTQHLRLP